MHIHGLVGLIGHLGLLSDRRAADRVHDRVLRTQTDKNLGGLAAAVGGLTWALAGLPQEALASASKAIASVTIL
ncbi:MAG: hypothetical protein AAFU70_11260, partial [Planctomycetota bacterium]